MQKDTKAHRVRENLLYSYRKKGQEAEKKIMMRTKILTHRKK